MTVYLQQAVLEARIAPLVAWSAHR